jgi:hypothetical protein
MTFEKTLLVVTPASFDISNNLKNAITQAIYRSPLKIRIPTSVLDIKSEEDLELTADDLNDDSIGEIVKVFLSMSHSRDVERCLWECCGRAVYDKAKVNKDFFEKVENREFYYPIMMEVVKVNVGPFIKGLLSQFGDVFGQIKSFLGSK